MRQVSRAPLIEDSKARVQAAAIFKVPKAGVENNRFGTLYTGSRSALSHRLIVLTGTYLKYRRTDNSGRGLSHTASPHGHPV